MGHFLRVAGCAVVIVAMVGPFLIAGHAPVCLFSAFQAGHSANQAPPRQDKGAGAGGFGHGAVPVRAPAERIKLGH